MKETKLLCKKDFNSNGRRFFVNKQYRYLDTGHGIESTSDRQIYIIGEDGNGFWFRRIDKKIMNNYLEFYAWEYFYTQNEVRREKLNKLKTFE